MEYDNGYGGKQGAFSGICYRCLYDGVPWSMAARKLVILMPLTFYQCSVDYPPPEMVAAYKKIIAFRAAPEAIKPVR